MRYFIISFAFSTTYGSGTGDTCAVLDRYPSREAILKTVRGKVENCTSVSITNIIELTEQDYDDHLRVEPEGESECKEK